MSAINRATDAIAEQWAALAASGTSGDPYAFATSFATRALTAALDVEEMARAFVAPSSWDELSDPVKNEYRIRMRHVRTSILGES
jgi:hypothetical protein